jgi:hypothetical protein
MFIEEFPDLVSRVSEVSSGRVERLVGSLSLRSDLCLIFLGS